MARERLPALDKEYILLQGNVRVVADSLPAAHREALDRAGYRAPLEGELLKKTKWYIIFDTARRLVAEAAAAQPPAQSGAFVGEDATLRVAASATSTDSSGVAPATPAGSQESQHEGDAIPEEDSQVKAGQGQDGSDEMAARATAAHVRATDAPSIPATVAALRTASAGTITEPAASAQPRPPQDVHHHHRHDHHHHHHWWQFTNMYDPYYSNYSPAHYYQHPHLPAYSNTTQFFAQQDVASVGLVNVNPHESVLSRRRVYGSGEIRKIEKESKSEGQSLCSDYIRFGFNDDCGRDGCMFSHNASDSLKSRWKR